VHRKVVCISGVDILAYVRADEEALFEEYAFVLRLAVRSRAFRVEMMEMQVGYISGVCPAAKGLDEAMGYTGYAA